MKIFSKASRLAVRVLKKAEDIIEDERKVVVPESMVNAAMERFITNNVEALQDIHVDINDDWLRLFSSIDYKDLNLELSVDLKLVSFELNAARQVFIFEQISNTNVIDMKINNAFKRGGVKFLLFYYQKLLRKDPLGSILSKLGVVEVKDGLVHIDINQYLDEDSTFIRTLKKVQINHAVLSESSLVLLGNVNLIQLLTPSSWDMRSIYAEAENAESESDPTNTSEEPLENQ